MIHYLVIGHATNCLFKDEEHGWDENGYDISFLNLMFIHNELKKTGG